MQMVTDPQRMRRTDPGNPDVCNVFSHAQDLLPAGRGGDDQHANAARPGIGCVDCKKLLAPAT